MKDIHFYEDIIELECRLIKGDCALFDCLLCERYLPVIAIGVVGDGYATGKKFLGKETHLVATLEEGFPGWGNLVFQFRMMLVEIEGLVTLQTPDKEGFAEINICLLCFYYSLLFSPLSYS